jgi:HEAT repeat protein
MRQITLIAVFLCSLASSQELSSTDPKQRAKAARELGNAGSEAIAQLRPLLKDPVRDVRLEAVRAIVNIGTQHSLDPLIEATRDNDPEIQMRAADGLVNFYLPGYVQAGFQRLGAAVRSRLDQENTQIIEPYVTVRPEVIEALGRLVTGAASMQARANAARAIGVLRGAAAVPELAQALQTKDDDVIFESLIAMQKIRDESAGPRAAFLIRDLHEPVQIAAIETVGLLKTRQSIPDLQRIYSESSSKKVRRAALTALAMMPDPSSRPYFQRAIVDRDEGVRASAAEGFARLKQATDRSMLDAAFNDEKKMAPRLALAFALVSLGEVQTTEFAPLTYLVNTLNSRSYRNVAQPYLIEAARDEKARASLYGYLKAGTEDEKIGLLRVLAASGDRSSVTHVEPLTKDPDSEVAQEAIRAFRTLQSRAAHQ